MLLVLFLPLISTIQALLCGRYLGQTLTKYISTCLIIISALLNIYYFKQIVINNEIISINCGNWINIDYLVIDWSFTFDKLTMTMLLAVLTISALVHTYSLSYMAHDPHQPRFFGYLSMFTFFMQILITSNNYLIMFIGWEYIGIASYLLISFWMTQTNAMKSALSAVLLNRCGDAFFVLALIILVWSTGSLNFITIFCTIPYINTDIINLIMICFLLAATAKSAQLGLHTWLLYAMAGPTPVSALLHAATLVTAGIYLLLRSSYILEYAPSILLTILWLGGLTTIFAGLIAIVTNDIKKVIALSTMSQLGMMVIALGLSSYNLALFHLLCHSFFKALLFMSAGAIIHSVLSETQDLRLYGGLINYLPLTYTCLLIASLSLMAVPSLTGFYSKDIIIESTYGTYEISGFIIYWLSLGSATLTSLYSFRILYLTFYNNPNSPKFIYLNVKESDINFSLPMFILALCSIFIGYILKDIYIGLGSDFNSLFIHPSNESLISSEFTLPFIIKILPLINAILGTTLLLLIYESYYKLLYIYNNKYIMLLYNSLNNKFYFDQILNNLIIRSTLNISGNLNQHIDKGTLYIMGPQGSWKIFNKISNKISLLNNGLFSSYVQYILFSIITLFIFILFKLNYTLLIIILFTLI